MDLVFLNILKTEKRVGDNKKGRPFDLPFLIIDSFFWSRKNSFGFTNYFWVKIAFRFKTSLGIQKYFGPAGVAKKEFRSEKGVSVQKWHFPARK